MNVAKLLFVKSIRKCSFGRHVSIESKSVQGVQKTNKNTMFNKNLVPINYIKESNSNKHFLWLPDVFNYWLKVPQDTLRELEGALDYVLHGVVLLDDVQDGTQFRRNLPSAHRIYGTPWAANASTFCFMAALKKIADLGNPEAVDNYCQEMMSALDGIALDLYWRDAFVCPTEDDYIEMVKLKNSFFTLNLRIIQPFSEDRRCSSNRGSFRDLMNTYGVYYQIRDEYANLVNVKKNLVPINYIKESNSNKHFLWLPDVFNYWLKVPQDTLRELEGALDYVLHGVVLLDDVQDGTQFRRNLPSAHRIYGTPWAANASTFCFMAALKKIADLGNPEAVDIYCQEMMSALDGIALDLYWRDAFVCPTEDDYIEMVKLKNSFFTLNLRIIQPFSEDRRSYRDLMNTYGVYYQIRDEYANLVNVKGLDTKSHEQEFKNLHEVMFCEDITEGRFTFPMIHGLNSSEGPTIRSILVQRTNDSRIKQHCLSLLEKVGSLDYTRQTLHDLDADLREQIHHLGGNPVFLAYLDELSNWK